MALRFHGRLPTFSWLVRTYRVSSTHLSQRGSKISFSYSILEVAPECEDAEVRDAYLNLAKCYHPDSDSKHADTVKFAQIEEAYRTVMAERSSKAKAQQQPKEDESMKMEFDIEHNAPQHRQYLSFEGKGYGTPSQRQKQYAAMRAAQAYENVHDYQTQQISAKYETQIVRKDKEATRKRTLRNAIDRLVEDLIQESMARGEFKNLPGMGKPLKTSFDYNPMVDSTTHNLNKIMIQNGYAPEWIMIEREIKQQIAEAREELLAERIKLGEPFTHARQRQWDRHLESFNRNILNINKRVSTFNLVTPILRQQIVPYSTEREARKILKKYEELLQKGELPEKEEKNNFVTPVSFSPEERISMAVVWKELKALFNS